MIVQGALWLAKRYPLTLISVLLNQEATQLLSRDWVDPVQDSIIAEKFLVYGRESNPGPLR